MARHLDRQATPFLLGHRPVELGQIGEHRCEVERGKGGAPRAGLDLGDPQQGLEHRDDAVQIGRRPLDRGAQLGHRPGMRRGVLQPGPRAGDRRAQVVRDRVETWRTPSISRPMRSSMSLMVSASWSNSSPRPDSLTRWREIARRDRRRGGGDIGQRAAEQAAHHQRADGCHRQTTTSAHSSASVSSAAQLRPHLHVAPDQQLEATRQVEALHTGERAHAGALDRQLVPGAVLRRALRPALRLPASRRPADPTSR